MAKACLIPPQNINRIIGASGQVPVMLNLDVLSNHELMELFAADDFDSWPIGWQRAVHREIRTRSEDDLKQRRRVKDNSPVRQ